MKIKCFFGAEATPDGLGFGRKELLPRFEGFLAQLREEPEAHGLFAEGAAGFRPVARYSWLLRTMLIRGGVEPERIHICRAALSTLTELDAMEEWLREHPKFNEQETLSSWYHLWRIRKLWVRRHGRVVQQRSLPVPMSFYIAKRVLTEILKIALISAPPRVQDTLGEVARKTGLM